MAKAASLSRRLTAQIMRAEDAEHSSAEASAGYDKLRANSEAEKYQLKQEAGDAMQSERAMRKEELKKSLDEKEEMIGSLKSRADAAEGEMRREADELSRRLNALMDEKSAASAENEKLRNTLGLQDDAVRSIAEEGESLKSRLRIETEEKKRAERSLHQTQLRVAALEQSNESQQLALEQADAMRRAAESVTARASESAGAHRCQFDEAQSKLSVAESELIKLRDALDRYRRDRQDAKNRMKGKVELIRKQEEALADKEAEAMDSQQRLDDIIDELERARKEMKRKEVDLNEARIKLTESGKMLESNQQVIAWLNKEINDSQLGRPGRSSTAPFYGMPVGSKSQFGTVDTNVKFGMAPLTSAMRGTGMTIDLPQYQSSHMTPDLRVGSDRSAPHAPFDPRLCNTVGASFPRPPRDVAAMSGFDPELNPSAPPLGPTPMPNKPMNQVHVTPDAPPPVSKR